MGSGAVYLNYYSYTTKADLKFFVNPTKIEMEAWQRSNKLGNLKKRLRVIKKFIEHESYF